ncbi:hypothetical protein PGT21_026624 [Puccinia graminis f. sp. tritici]|uniref:Uncharacterized protein n=1 Tax=Puccinia graminis f. sp. tritici TaxID=56615 RepID=A0A5B0P8W7_PUCGR|nr:hypothetical protein PGT21_026624 [Puccinia graminis f. sp. tritici]KAA1117022.1 hypothetical protein PGTUg99_034188 [Puccinia graminis f. sp. tritici]
MNDAGEELVSPKMLPLYAEDYDLTCRWSHKGSGAGISIPKDDPRLLFVRVRVLANFPFGQVRILIGALLGAALGTHAHRDGQSRSC